MSDSSAVGDQQQQDQPNQQQQDQAQQQAQEDQQQQDQAQNQVEQPAKKKRRSRWDTSTPITPTASTTTTTTTATTTTTDTASTTASTANTTAASTTATPNVVVDTAVAQQLVAQQVLQMQQAQLGQQPPLPQTLAMPSLLAPPPPPPVADCRIYVGSLNYDLKEADIKALFASFGAIRSFTMSYDNVTGKSKGYCFVEYESPESAVSALAMNQFQLAGRPIKVGRPLNGAPGSAAPPINPVASLLNIPIPSAPVPTPATSAQAFINGLGVGNTNPPM